MILTTCAIVAYVACAETAVAHATPVPAAPQAASPGLTDPCGGYQELLKKYLSASPCVFVRGQGSVQMTYSGSSVPTFYSTVVRGHTLTWTESSETFGYPGALINVGVTPSSQVTLVLPAFSQIASTQSGIAAGTTDMEFRYKQLLYWNRKGGILGGMLVTYKAPTGSPGLSAGAPSYEVNPLFNVALNSGRSIAENLSFPVTNSPGASPGQARMWTFAPQAVTVYRSPGGTLLAVIAQYAFSTHVTNLTFNTAQLLSRNFQLQATYGGNDSAVDYVSPVEGVGPASGTAYSRSFTIGISYMAGYSDAPPP